MKCKYPGCNKIGYHKHCLECGKRLWEDCQIEDMLCDKCWNINIKECEEIDREFFGKLGVDYK